MRRSQPLQRNRRKEQNKIEDIRRTYTVRAVVQRVTHASVTVDGEVLGKIGKGFMILLGAENEDTEESFSSSASLLFTRTVKRATGPASSGQENPSGHRSYMFTLWSAAGSMCLWWRRASSGLI